MRTSKKFRDWLKALPARHVFYMGNCQRCIIGEFTKDCIYDIHPRPKWMEKVEYLCASHANLIEFGITAARVRKLLNIK